MGISLYWSANSSQVDKFSKHVCCNSAGSAWQFSGPVLQLRRESSLSLACFCWQVSKGLHAAPPFMPKRKAHFLPRENLGLANAYAQAGLRLSHEGKQPLAQPDGARAAASGNSSCGSSSGLPDDPGEIVEAKCHDPKRPSVRTGRSDRPDIPLLRDHVRASASGAKATAANQESFETALENLDRDMYAATSVGPREAVWATYKRFHVYAMGYKVSLLPLTPESVRRVAALFKAAGYRSYRNYISRARDEHLALGHEITPKLERIMRLCRRSVVRGLAGAREVRGFRV